MQELMKEYVLSKDTCNQWKFWWGGYFRYLVNHRYWYLAPNASALNAVYTFSAADTMANQVDLILTTNDPTGLCGPAKDTLHVIIDPESIINAGPDQTVCAADTLFLHATLSGVATNMVWEKNVASGTL